jgi:ribose transport system substrate-binding protein
MFRIRSNRLALVSALALTVPVSLASPATASDDTDAADTSAPPTTLAESGSDGGTEPVEGATMGVSFYDNKVIPLYVDMEAGMTEEAAEHGADITFSYANFDPAAQVDQIQQYITRQVDVILVTPFDRNALLPAYEAAREAGIPIISFANKVDDEYEDLFVGRDWSEMGELQMGAIADALGGEGQVAVIGGPPEIDVARQVSEGWHSVLDENPGLELVEELVDPDMSRERGLDLANTLLAANPDVQGIACTIDQICLGAVQAIDEQGLSQDDIFVASLDADAEAVEQVKAGTGIDFTIGMKGVTWGHQVVQEALDYLAGQVPAEHMVESEFVVVDADSVETLQPDDLK